MSKTRHREYVDAIKYTKERLMVGADYQPFLINRALWRNEEDFGFLNMVNRKPVPIIEGNIEKFRLHEKQMHFDFLLRVIEQKTRK